MMLFFVVFFVSVNAQCETSCQVNLNTNPNPYHNHYPQPYQALEQSRDDGTTTITQQSQGEEITVIQHNLPSNDYHNRMTADAHSQNRCNPGDMIPNSSDCTSYYECVNGQYELRLCPSNTFFDPSVKCCRADYVCPNRAYEQPITPRPSCNYGEVRADDTSCRHYYLCVGDDRHFERRICPDDKIFNRQLNRCVTSTTENRCHLVAQAYESRNVGVGLACIESSGPSGYSADPTDCRRYYQCAQGRWVRMHCPANLVWNPAATVCDWPKNTLLSCQ